jgi:hypothetical protein
MLANKKIFFFSQKKRQQKFGVGLFRSAVSELLEIQRLAREEEACVTEDRFQA